MITGLTPIHIKLEETALYYNLTKEGRKGDVMIDKDTSSKHWLHPAVTMNILTNNNEDKSKIQIFTNGSKCELGVGAGIAIYTTGTHTKSLKYRLDVKCTNTQMEQLAILRSLEYIENLQTVEKTAIVYTAQIVRRRWTPSKTAKSTHPLQKQ